MTRAKGLLVVLTSVLLLAWFAGGGRDPHPRAANPERSRIADEAGVAGLGEHEARLRARLSAASPLHPSRRNLFQFGAVAPSRARFPRVSPAAHEPPAAPEGRPAMQLLGIAEDGDNGRTIRTAIVSATGQLFCVREGERVLGRFEVVRIGADAVELKDGSGTVTLALK